MSGAVAGKIALVTGAASGIGRACARRLAAEGAVVIVSDVQDEAGLAVVEAIRADGGTAEWQRLDVTNEANWQALIAGIVERHGGLDVLVNNAGVALGAPTTKQSVEEFNLQLMINVTGPFLGCKHAIPVMQARGGGSIINMSSTAGLRGSTGMAGYSASKGAVRLFTKAVANEHARDNIRVNSVHPGLIETPIWMTIDSPSAPRGVMPDVGKMAASLVPLGVKGLPEDIANGVLWLASDESRYVTGSELVIDGGLSGR
ncbi:SDR family NAD(P)-dependent oxidoreductase [Novosphingobium bradum]|uniref:SDR family NAD(P)-dependent oxidoreductase n=1 Tax=Novosphingobium bradum TaxID=1737444 RepID=A0ABV7ILE1_9SPHN